MIAILVLTGIIATLYQIVALLASLHHLAADEPAASDLPPLSILKPVRGLDSQFSEAIRSHAEQEYPEFEILFGVTDPNDPAIPEIERLQSAYPNRVIRWIHCTAEAANRKAGVLAELAGHARHQVLLVNDADVHVPPNYLRRVVAPLSDSRVGVVTCLYRGAADSGPGRWESLGIATDFAPSVLVAPLIGVREFGLGSTLAFRAGHLHAIGGFEAVADYLADDYQLTKRITGLSTRALISKVVVETHLGEPTWAGVWRHQVRWARTIRVSRGGGYLGLPLTHATLWAILLFAQGLQWLPAFLLSARMASGLTAGIGVLRSPIVTRYFFLIPLWDLWAFAVWLTGLFGDTVVWRGERLKLTRDGRIDRGEK